MNNPTFVLAPVLPENVYPVQPPHPMEWLDHNALATLSFPQNIKNIMNIKFNNIRETACSNIEKKYIILAILDYYEMNAEFRGFIDMVKQTKKYDTQHDLKVWCRTHTSNKSIYDQINPHITMDVVLPCGKTHCHLYWNTKSPYPQFYSMTASIFIAPASSH